MATLERTYNIPLRREFLKEKNYKRTQKAVKALREYLQKHMKADSNNVKIGPKLNDKLWENGIKCPPHHVRVNVIKDENGLVWAELFGAPRFEAKKVEEKKDEGLKGKLADAVKKTDKKEEKSEKKDSAVKGEKKPEVKAPVEEKKTEKPSTETKKEEKAPAEKKVEKPSEAKKDSEKKE